MHKTTLLALLLAVWSCAGAQSSLENQELTNAALRLKQAAVLRTLEDCKAKGGSVKSCNSLLELTHQRELKIIARLKLAPTDPAVNMDEVSKESAACYDYGYVELVECWSQLSDRLDAARKGQLLLRSTAPANAAHASEPRTVVIYVIMVHVNAAPNPAAADFLVGGYSDPSLCEKQRDLLHDEYAPSLQAGFSITCKQIQALVSL
jgi:hypothetical protein